MIVHYNACAFDIWDGLDVEKWAELEKHINVDKACQTGGPHAAPLLVLCGTIRNFPYSTI